MKVFGERPLTDAHWAWIHFFSPHIRFLSSSSVLKPLSLASGRTKWLLHCVNVPCCTASCSHWPFIRARKVSFFTQMSFFFPQTHPNHGAHLMFFPCSQTSVDVKSKYLTLVPLMGLDDVYGIKEEFNTAFPHCP